MINAKIVQSPLRGMKYRMAAALAIMLILLIPGCGGGTTSSVDSVPTPAELEAQGFASPELPRISAQALKVMYDNRDPYVLVDVRSRAMFLTEYIRGARNIPNEPEDESIAALTQLPKDKLIILYCD
jgi:hypothetical protein